MRSPCKIYDNDGVNKEESPPFKTKVSLSYLEEKIFNWLKENFIKKYRNRPQEQLIDFFEQDLNQSLKEHSVWIPIANFVVQSPITCKNTTIQSLDNFVINKWENNILGNIDKEDIVRKEQAKIKWNQYRKKFQEYTCIVVKVFGELSFAQEYSSERAKIITSLIGVFSGALINSNAKCLSKINGTEDNKIVTYFVEKDKTIDTIFNGKIDDNPMNAFVLDNNRIGLMYKLGFQKILTLLDSQERNKFEEKALNFLFLYSKAAFTSEPIEKVVFILSSLESILLKNSSEPVQQNLGKRLAFFISDKSEERKRISKLFREIYSFRSKYIHHGITSGETKIVQDFLIKAWIFLALLLNNYENFEEKNDFIEFIDDKKFQ